jgi:hypothetical protein
LSDPQQDPVSVKGTERDGFENEKIERAWKEFGFVAHVFSPKIIRRLTRAFLSCQGEIDRNFRSQI